MARDPTYGLRRYWRMRYTMGKGQVGRSLASVVTHTPYLHRHPYANTDASCPFTTYVVCLYVNMHVYIYFYVFIFVRIYLCMYACMCLCMYI